MPYSDRASVETWVEGVVEANDDIETPTSRKRKRKRDQPEPGPRVTSTPISRPLTRAAAKAMAPKAKAQGENAKEDGKGKKSGPVAKRPLRNTQLSPGLPNGVDLDTDDGKTPDAENESSGPSQAPGLRSTDDTGTTVTGKSGKTPTTIISLRELENQVDFESVKYFLQKGTCPANVEKFFTKIHQFARGGGVISQKYKDELRNNFEYGHHFDESGERDELGATPDKAVVDDILERVGECMKYVEFEAGWNSLVHHHIGRVALQLSPCRQNLRFANITTASINPTSLVPAKVSGQKIQKTKIDFAIVLLPDKELELAFRNLEVVPGSDTTSFNQTNHDPIRETPISVNIETKRRGNNLLEGQTQVAVWAVAQFARWRLLVKEAGNKPAKMPIIPLIVAQGPTWELQAATQDSAGNVTVWDYGRIGDTAELIGVYQIIATLQYLMHWSDTELRKWFKKNAMLRPKRRA